MDVSLNLLKAKDRKSAFRTHLYLQRKFEKGAQKRVLAIFKGEKNRVLEQFNSGVEIPVIDQVPWRSFLLALYEEVGREFGLAFAKSLNKIQKADPWLEYILDYIRTHGLEKASRITETTKRDLRELISEGLQEGLGVQEIAAKIEDYYSDLSARALLIARTETHSAANLGTSSFARDSGMSTHTWLSAMDELTRDWHRTDQTVPLSEPYIIEGEELMFPGDGSLGATGMNLCNCRCAETYA